MPVPETSMNKDHSTSLCEHQIRASRKIADVRSKPIAHCMKRATYKQLGFRVCATNTAHHSASLSWRHYIHHQLILRLGTSDYSSSASSFLMYILQMTTHLSARVRITNKKTICRSFCLVSTRCARKNQYQAPPGCRRSMPGQETDSRSHRMFQATMHSRGKQPDWSYCCPVRDSQCKPDRWNTTLPAELPSQ